MKKYLNLITIVALIAALILSAGCSRNPGYIPVSRDVLKGSGKLYLVPLGGFPSETIDVLAAFYRAKYNLQIETLPNVPLPQNVVNPERQQLIAEAAVEVMKQAYPKLRDDPSAIMIGLTNVDMYIAKYDWRFSFSFRAEGKYAVVSSGRMYLPRDDKQQVSANLILTRLRKMVTKNVGILYYHLSQNDHPRSVLYRNVGGMRELDFMGEEF